MLRASLIYHSALSLSGVENIADVTFPCRDPAAEACPLSGRRGSRCDEGRVERLSLHTFQAKAYA